MAPAPCKVCGVRPKEVGRHKCIVCRVRADSIEVQVEESRRRLAMIPEELRKRVIPARLWPEGTRWCGGCQSFRDLEDFGKDASQCRACLSARSHASRIEKVFGLDADGYEALLKRQGGKCAICRNRPKKKRLAVDHDHKSGAVRGLLCSRCNHELLGAGWDSISVLQAAVDYLLTPPATGHWSAPEDKSPEGAPTPVDPFTAPSEAGDRRGAPGASSGPESGFSGAVSYRPTYAVSDPAGAGYWRVYVQAGVEGPPPF